MSPILALLGALSLLLTSCASQAPPTSEQRAASEQGASSEEGGDAGFPVTVTAANGPVELRSRPLRIVSLSPTATEMLFAIGAGDQVVATDENSDYPASAPTTDLSGYEPNVEAVAARDPDLVVLSNDPGGVLGSLRKLAIPALLQPAAETFGDSYTQINQLGAATGNVTEAAELVRRMRSRIERIVDSTNNLSAGPPLTYYHELDQHLFTVTSETFIGRVYALFQLRNIADVAEGARSRYPQLSAEHIITSDPDLIFLADAECCDVTPKVVAARPGWDEIAAVRRGDVYAIDEDIASRWGPRIVAFARAVARAVGQVERSPA
jgi:iron complex transport system substrate-binding protein